MSEPNKDQQTPAPKDGDLPDPVKEKINEVLSEKKKIQEQLVKERKEKEDLIAKMQLTEIEKMKAVGDKDAVIQTYEKQLKEYEAEKTKFKEEKDRNAKLAAVKQELVKQGADAKGIDYLLRTVDLQRLKFDPDHNVVLGTDTVVKEIRENLSGMFGVQTPQMNSNAPDINTNVTSIEAFNKLPLKDRRDPAKLRALYEAQGIQVKK